MRSHNKNDTALFLPQIAIRLCICVCCMHPGLAQTDISKIKPNSASLQPVQIPSHEALLNGFNTRA